ncbi:MAG TPA: SET domain-containing protein [Candidatus Paceibacterota bacterium]|jgi:SET domain-containing protein|nr:SET domain-containing protein [Candidatus Paceibacterota bacterium]
MSATKTTPKYSVGTDLKIKKGLNGLGLFTTVPMKKGDCIIEYVGDILKTGQEANERGGQYLFEVSSKKTIDGYSRSNTARYINHSCRPNCEVDIIKGRVFIYAKRGVKEGEELCYDYGKEFWNEYIKPKGCRCVKCSEKKNGFTSKDNKK